MIGAFKELVRHLRRIRPTRTGMRSSFEENEAAEHAGTIASPGIVYLPDIK